MKRNLLIFAIFAAALTVQAQKRLVLVEEFTNTGCGPCASWSPVLDSALFYRMGECIAIKYHSSYPDRNDPFYLYDQENKEGVDAVAIGISLVQDTYNDYLAAAKANANSKEINGGIMYQADGQMIFIQTVGTSAYFGVFADNVTPAQMEKLVARFTVVPAI